MTGWVYKPQISLNTKLDLPINYALESMVEDTLTILLSVVKFNTLRIQFFDNLKRILIDDDPAPEADI